MQIILGSLLFFVDFSRVLGKGLDFPGVYHKFNVFSIFDKNRRIFYRLDYKLERIFQGSGQKRRETLHPFMDVLQSKMDFPEVQEKINVFSRVGVRDADFLGGALSFVIGFSGGQGKILRIFLD